MLNEPKLTNTLPDFGKPPENQNDVNIYFNNIKAKIIYNIKIIFYFFE